MTYETNINRDLGRAGSLYPRLPQLGGILGGADGQDIPFGMTDVDSDRERAEAEAELRERGQI